MAHVDPLPEPALREMAQVARALADPTRIEILRLLAPQQGPVCACDIVEHFHLSQPTVSHHLKILKAAKLVTASRRGLWMFYELRAGGAAIVDKLAALLR